jgi:hypothetical protein
MVAVLEEGGSGTRHHSSKHEFLAEKFYPRKIANNVAEATCGNACSRPVTNGCRRHFIVEL